MKESKAKWSQDQIAEAVQAARAGKRGVLSRFFSDLYERGKHSLLGITKSEEEAEYYFTEAILKFERLFVEGDKVLPDSNVEGYIFMIAKSLYYNELRAKQKVVLSEQPIEDGADENISSKVYEQEEQERSLKQHAMLEGIKKLTQHCQELFNAILETGEEKTSKLQQMLGWESPRIVTTRKTDCKKQLKKKAAMIYEELLSAKMK